MKLIQSTAPTSYPVSRNEMKTYLRIEHSDENSLIDSLIYTATVLCEKRIHRSLITQSWTLYYDNFPAKDYMGLYNGEIQTIDSVKYYDTADTVATLAATEYYLVDEDMKGKVTLKYNKFWPTTTLRPRQGVEIIYTAGYGDDSTDIPESIRQGIMNMVAHLYENREQTDITIPEIVKDLWSTYKIWTV